MDPPPPGTTNATDMLVELSKFEIFDPASCSWPTFAERLQNHFELYNVSTEKRVRILIARLSITMYEKLRELCEPVAPLNKTFEELSAIVAKHCDPYSNKFKERVKFARRFQRAKEDVLEYATELQSWAKNCKFPDSWLHEALITQFLNGIRSEFLRTKLFALEECDFHNLVRFAIDIESTPAYAIDIAAAAQAKSADVVKQKPTTQAQLSDGSSRINTNHRTSKGPSEEVVGSKYFKSRPKSSAYKNKKPITPAPQASSQTMARKNLQNKNTNTNQTTKTPKNKLKLQNKNQFKNQPKPQFVKNSQSSIRQFGDDIKDVLRNQFKDLHKHEYSNQNYKKGKGASSTFVPRNSLGFR